MKRSLYIGALLAVGLSACAPSTQQANSGGTITVINPPRLPTLPTCTLVNVETTDTKITWIPRVEGTRPVIRASIDSKYIGAFSGETGLAIPEQGYVVVTQAKVTTEEQLGGVFTPCK